MLFHFTEQPHQHGGGESCDEKGRPDLQGVAIVRTVEKSRTDASDSTCWKFGNYCTRECDGDGRSTTGMAEA